MWEAFSPEGAWERWSAQKWLTAVHNLAGTTQRLGPELGEQRCKLPFARQKRGGGSPFWLPTRLVHATKAAGVILLHALTPGSANIAALALDFVRIPESDCEMTRSDIVITTCYECSSCDTFLKKNVSLCVWFMTQLSVSLWRQLRAMNGYYMHALSLWARHSANCWSWSFALKQHHQLCFSVLMWVRVVTLCMCVWVD